MQRNGERPISDEELDAMIMEREIEQASSLIDSKEKYRKIINAGIARWVKDFQNDKIKIETVDDLKKLIEIDLELQRDDL